MSARDELRRSREELHRKLDEELRSVLTETGRAPTHELIDKAFNVYANRLADLLEEYIVEVGLEPSGLPAVIRPNGEKTPDLMGELPGMWEESDLSGGWADTDGAR